MAAVIVVLALLEGVANPVLAAAFGFDLPATAHFGSLLDRGPGAAELLRWGALLDMAGYLALGLVVVYIGERLRQGKALVVASLTLSGSRGTAPPGTVSRPQAPGSLGNGGSLAANVAAAAGVAALMEPSSRVSASRSERRRAVDA